VFSLIPLTFFRCRTNDWRFNASSTEISYWKRKS
jgi:hypothetical protein